jgi:hypothetical protein
MKLPWKIVKKTYTPADETLEIIKGILFPPLALNSEMSKDGEVMKYHVDYSADTNLDAALIDLQEGHNDPVVHKTINSIIKRLNKVRKILEAYPELDKDAKYIIVDDMEEELDVSAAED